jgi:hypothetical protein
MICAKSGSNWLNGSGEEVENVKVYRRTEKTDRRTIHNGRSGELKKGKRNIAKRITAATAAAKMENYVQNCR